MFKKKFPSLASLGSDGNTAFLRAARAGQLDKVLEHLKANIDINTSNTNGLNALHLASKDGHIAVVTELLRRGASVDAATKKGNTALHIASLAGQEEVVKLLVANGAAVNVQSQNGFTPLYMAAQENHDNVVRFLLANGANQSLATEDGFTPLAVAMQQGHDKVVAVLLESDTRGKVRLPALHIAAKKDDCKAAALLLQNEHNPDVTSKSGFTPLHIAAHYGNESIATLLLNRGADVNYSAKHNITPLHVAAKWGKTNMVSLLLEKGANIESKTRDGLTPLHCAARSGHEQVVDMMLERGAPISSKTKNGLAPLHMASQGDHVDAARILLYHRAPVDEVTVDYLTALHVAAHCGHVRVAKLLLDRKADPNARALNGFTPLHIACKKNRIKVVELLLKHGASIEATTESGLTPLHVASFMGCMNIVIYLLQHDASPDVPTVRGETPLHLAARANQTDIIRILLRNGAEVDARAREQQTPLHIASRLGNVDIVMLLLQHGAHADSTTKDMYTALHIAAKEGQEEVASVLLEGGASLTATTKKGFTPLHLAAKYGNMKVAKLLLQKDAPVDAQAKNAVTPLHVASHYDHQNVALLLLDKGASPHATAKNGHTPLHIAARKNQMDIATTLLEYGAKANAESKAGFTPLHLSAQEGHTDMSTLLLEHQAGADHRAKNGLSPLHLCAQEDRVSVAHVLVKNGAEVDATTKAGYTPLHVASHFGQMNMVRMLLNGGASPKAATAIGYTPLHQAAQQGHTAAAAALLDSGADPNAVTSQGQTALSIAQKLGYISVVETLKGVTDAKNATPLPADEKYRVVAPETMQETFMSDSEDEGGEDTMLSDQPYRYLTVDEMKSLGDDSLPIDVTRDERIDSNKEATTASSAAPPTAVGDDTTSPQHAKEMNYLQYTGANYAADNVELASRHPVHVGKLHWKNFLVSFLVDARGGAMRGCRHSGVRVIVPPRKAAMPTRVTCRYLKRDKLTHPPPLMEGEALASRILELGPVGAKFLGPVVIEVPHFGSLRGAEREIVVLRSDNGETWREHSADASEDAVRDVLHESFEGEELAALEEAVPGRTTRILTSDFPQYFAIVSRVRQEVHAIGPEGGMVSSSVVPQVQAVFPQGALTKKIKVGLQAQPIPADLTAKLLGNRVAVSPIVTVEPRRRKFHKPITLTIPVPQAANKGMINQYSGDAPTLRLLCSITGGTTRAQWEDVTGSTPLTFVNDCVSFTTTVSARFWLMDCRNIAEATKMATELYKEAIHVPFMAKFVVFAKRVDALEARLRVFCMTDDKEDKTLEQQEHFTEVAKSRDVEVLEGKPQYIEFAGNLVPVTKSGDQLQLGFRAFRENRLPFTVRVKDPHADTVGRMLFMREPKVPKGEPPQQPVCILNIVLPETIVPESGVSEPDLLALQSKYRFLRDGVGRPDAFSRASLRLADISNLLGDDWVPLALQLGLTTSDINVIKSQQPGGGAHQAMAMLRLWLRTTGNKATSNTLEAALRKVGRDDVVQQCIFNTEEVERAVARVRADQAGFDALKEEIGPSRDASLRRDAALDAAFEEQDIMKESESVEELVQAEKKEPRKEAPPGLSTRAALEALVADKLPPDVVDERERDETKYIGEEKMVVEEERRTVAQLKEIFAQDKRDRQYERQPRSDEDASSHLSSSTMEDSTADEDTTRARVPPPTAAPEGTERRDSFLFEGVSQELARLDTTYKVTPAPESVLSPKVSKTPPPSPAEFKETAGAPAWQSGAIPPPGPGLAPTECTVRPCADDETEGSRREPIVGPSAESPQSSIPRPRPSPRSAPQPPSPLTLTRTDPDDTLTETLDDQQEVSSYSDRRKFWEQMTGATAPPPTPAAVVGRGARPATGAPPSVAVIAAAVVAAEAEVESDPETTTTTLSDSTVRAPAPRTASAVSKQSTFTGSSDASDREGSPDPPPPPEPAPRLPRGESQDSEAEYLAKVERSELAFDNTAFEEEEEAHDKLSAAAVPRASAIPVPMRRHERSASLPACDLDPAIASVRDKKKYFEAQMRPGAELEEEEAEPSPEHKALRRASAAPALPAAHSSERMVARQIHSDIFHRELEERIEDTEPEAKALLLPTPAAALAAAVPAATAAAAPAAAAATTTTVRALARAFDAEEERAKREEEEKRLKLEKEQKEREEEEEKRKREEEERRLKLEKEQKEREQEERKKKEEEERRLKLEKEQKEREEERIRKEEEEKRLKLEKEQKEREEEEKRLKLEKEQKEREEEEKRRKEEDEKRLKLEKEQKEREEEKRRKEEEEKRLKLEREQREREEEDEERLKRETEEKRKRELEERLRLEAEEKRVREEQEEIERLKRIALDLERKHQEEVENQRLQKEEQATISRLVGFQRREEEEEKEEKKEQQRVAEATAASVSTVQRPAGLPLSLAREEVSFTCEEVAATVDAPALAEALAVVDKSETEDSEKARASAAAAAGTDVPAITVTLSGKQRTDSDSEDTACESDVTPEERERAAAASDAVWGAPEPAPPPPPPPQQQTTTVADQETRKALEGEARQVAAAVLRDLEAALATRPELSPERGPPPPSAPAAESQVAAVLARLAEEAPPPEMVRAALERRLVRGDTAATASSVEITDEDLRSSGADTDLSPPAELLAAAAAAGAADDELEKTLAEVRQSLGAAQETLLSERGGKQKPSPSEFEFKALTLESSLQEHIEEGHVEEAGAAAQEHVGASGLRHTAAHVLHAHVAQEDLRVQRSESVSQDGAATHAKETREQRVAEVEADSASVEDTLQTATVRRRVAGDFAAHRDSAHEQRALEEESVDAHGARQATRHLHASTRARTTTEEAAEETSAVQLDDGRAETSVRSGAVRVISESADDWIHETESASADGVTRSQHAQAQHSATTSTTVQSQEQHREERRMFKVDSGVLAEQRREPMRRTSSEESQRSLSQDESTAKSPEDTTTSSASSAAGRPVVAAAAAATFSSTTTQSPSQQPSPLLPPGGGGGGLAQVVLRRGPGSSLRAGHADRRSAAADLESAWSSSGESHYHSFEQTSESGRSYSRPCSSDVELLVAAAAGTAGSSEYESALTSLTSQELSSARSTDFHTAVSSFSSRDSMKSLDSESSGHLASVEVSSEASETLVPSALELERDMDDLEGGGSGAPVLEPYDTHIPTAVICGERPHAPSAPTPRGGGSGGGSHAHTHAHHRSSRPRPSSHRRDYSPEDDEDEDEELEDGRSSPFELLDGEDDDDDGSGGACGAVAGIKRSHEMIFQPEPLPLAADSPDSEGSLPDERLLASSLEDGSVASMASVRTVLEASPRGPSPTQQPQVVVAGEKTTADSGTSTTASGRPGAPLSSVTITTSSVAEHGVQSVCTQVTSQARAVLGHSNGPTQVDFVPEYDFECQFAEESPGSSPVAVQPPPPPPRPRPGHRRSESRAPAVPPTERHRQSASSRGKDDECDRVESDLGGALSFKEATQRGEERKEVDEAEPESYHTEADQGFHRDLRERRAAAEAAAASVPEDDPDEVEREAALIAYEDEDEEEEMPELDQSRPQSQVSKSDSEGHRPISSGFSDDRPDSELAELLKQCSIEGGRLGEDDEEEIEDPIERPPSPEPADLPEEPAAAAAGGVARGPRGVAEAEVVFRAVGRVPVHAVPSPGATPPIPEDLEPPTPPPVAVESALPPRVSPIPDITVTQHMTPLVDRSFHYPDLELEEQETAAAASATGTQAAQTPASVSSRASSATDTDQGREYVLGEEDGDDYISEEPELAELTKSVEMMSAEMTASAMSADLTASTADLTTSAEASAEDRTVYEATRHRRPPGGGGGGGVDDDDDPSPPGSASPGSDSFELVEKPDLTDDYVVIEEVGREADEEDTEGKSVRIGGSGGGGGAAAARARARSAPHAAPRRDDEAEEEPLAVSPPQPQTRLTRVTYYPAGPDAPHAVDDLGPFPFEDSPPTGGEASSAPAATGHPPQPNVRHAGVRTEQAEPDPEVEAGKKWIEMQFQAEHAAALAYGYDMEFERGPLEDIKEEEANDFDQSSGRVGSMGSYQTSIGSFGSVKESFSSTPEYDVLAGRRFFTRSGENDDVSMSSLQEFEQLERQMAMENARKRSHGSQDSLNGTGSSSGGRSAGSGSGSGSFGARATAHAASAAAAAAAQHLYSRSGQGDDVSLSSLKEFEGLESACIEAARIETQARQEEAALLSEIEEGHESQQISESESCDTMSLAAVAGGVAPPVAGESADSEDYERRMFEIDEIIRQAQSNVERFADTHDRLEASSPSVVHASSMRQPPPPPPPPAHWRDAGEDATRTSSDSLEEVAQGPSSDSAMRESTDSLDLRTVADRSGDVMTTSADSIEFQMGMSSGLDPLTDSIELPHDAGALMVASADSLDLAGPPQPSGATDSIEEDEDEHEVSHPHGPGDRSSSSGRDGDLSSSGAELLAELRAGAAGGAPPRADYMLGSTDSLEPSSSTATHATYQYETDSVMSGSFTSGGSNTMVSSTDTLDPAGAAALDAADLLAAAARAGAGAGAGAWFEDAPGGGQAFVTEVIEPSSDPDFSHTVRRTVELPPEVHSVTFRGPDAERALRDYVQRFAPGEDVAETLEEAPDGSVHVKRVVQRRVVMRAEDAPPELLAAAATTRPTRPDSDERPSQPSSSSSSAEAASHRTYAPRHAFPVVETQGPGLTTAPRLTEDEDDATLLPVESGGRSTASTTTSTTTTVRDVDGSVVTTVTRVTEQRGDSSSGDDARPL